MTRAMLILLGVILLAGVSHAANTTTAQVTQLSVELTDGSCIIGVPRLPSVRVKMEYATIDIPFKEIESIEFKANAPIIATMANGDRITAFLKLNDLRLRASFGDVVIPFKVVTRIDVTTEGTPVALKKGLILYYAFDKDEGTKVTDKSGNRKHGKLCGATWIEKGKVRGACKFEGKQNDYIEVSESQDFDKFEQITFAIWFRPTQWSSMHYNTMINKQFKYAIGFPLFLAHNSGHMSRRGLCITTYHESVFGKRYEAWREAYSGAKVALNQWHHGVGVYDGKSLKIYLNGELKGKAAVSGLKMPSNDQNVIIGGEKKGWSEWDNGAFHGSLDEVMIFKRALSEKEIKQLYKRHKDK